MRMHARFSIEHHRASYERSGDVGYLNASSGKPTFPPAAIIDVHSRDATASRKLCLAQHMELAHIQSVPWSIFLLRLLFQKITRHFPSWLRHSSHPAQSELLMQPTSLLPVPCRTRGEDYVSRENRRAHGSHKLRTKFGACALQVFLFFYCFVFNPKLLHPKPSNQPLLMIYMRPQPCTVAHTKSQLYHFEFYTMLL